LALDLESTSLAFSPKKQLAMLGHILTDEKFFMFVKDIVKPNLFTNPHVSKAYAAAVGRYNKYGRIPTVSELKDCTEVTAEGQATKIGIVARIDEAMRERSEYGLDALGTELTQWLHSQIFFQAVSKSQKLYNTGSTDQAYTIVESAIKDIRTTTFGNEKEEKFTNFSADMEALQVERAGALTTGLRLLDELLLPPAPGEVTGGSLLPGDTTIIMAPVNTGKTTTAINFIKPNIARQKHILFLTHEGRPADIKKKIWCAMLNTSEAGLFELQRSPEGLAYINKWAAYLDKYLTYIPMNRAGQCVEDVVGAIRRKQDELMAKNNGIGYSMLVDDYPALLSCNAAKAGQLAKRHIDDIVYGNFVQLGLEYKMHIVAAIQVNREGSKINKNAGGDSYKPLLTMENVAESFGVMMQATNVITLNRDPEDKSRNRMTFYLDKSRSSETGYAVVCNTNFGHAITHSDELGAAYYRGNTSMSDKIDDLLKQFKNDPKGIPDSAWIQG
jgi:hypothetical protein